MRRTILAGATFVLVVGFCISWPLVSPYGVNDVDFSVSRQGPSLAHPLGTDQFGRDLLTRLAAGGTTTLTIAGIALTIILGVGTAYGTTAALAAPKIDAVMMRIVDGLFALPRLPIAIVILVAVRLKGQNVETVALALAVVGWMLTARLVRGQVMSLVTRDFVTAARSLGGSNTHIALRHLIPNSAGILLVAILLELPTVVVGEAFFAVLGLGPDPPTATWGNIAQEGLHFDRLWQMTLATAAIATFALSANVLVDRLGDWLDPRRRTR
jgi:ABC-type dipeptide/oligopeptide/nickel transport system permease subunit